MCFQLKRNDYCLTAQHCPITNSSVNHKQTFSLNSLAEGKGNLRQRGYEFEAIVLGLNHAIKYSRIPLPADPPKAFNETKSF